MFNLEMANYSQIMDELFLELLGVALNRIKELSRIPSYYEWEQLYSMADKQALLGICYPAIRQLPNDQKPPLRNSQYVVSSSRASSTARRIA